MSTLLFYDNPIALNSVTHRNLKMKASDEGLKFTGKTNSVLLAGVEFPEACKHFPIVFSKTAGNRALPMALLGFRDSENLFVDAGGRWTSEYVPAYIRRYPFVLAKSDAGQEMTVCIDESYPGFGADEGLPLFSKGGEPTDYLKGVLSFLQDYQAQLQHTELFLQTLLDFDLLTDVSASVSLPGGERYSLTGLMMVDERKLQALPDEKVMRLFRSGELAWVYSHLVSISNFSRLPRMAGKPTPEDVTTPPSKAASATRKNTEPGQKPVRK